MKNLNLTKVFCLLWVICVALTINSPAQVFNTIANFSGDNGFAPASAMIQGVKGDFYGTTLDEGIGSEGNVYTVTAGGSLTSIFNFCSNGCTNGQFPFNAPVLVDNGFLYGTTQGGGAALLGNVYKITAGGTESNVYSFCVTTCDDGANPTSALIQAGGNLYGTTTSTIFKMTPSGALTTLFNYCNPNCGVNGPPYPNGLVQGVDGNLYGTTGGGNFNQGTIFKITPSGTLTTLHSFSGADGSAPSGALVQGPNGDFYGETLTGGKTGSNCAAFGSCGTIFKITSSGTFTTLHKFSGSDGANPSSGLVLGTDGNFYGVTSENGPGDAGTIFQMNRAGKVTTLYSFCSQPGCQDGANPEGALMQATSGTFYGTTKNGGTDTDGTIFSLSMGLGPFVQIMPSSDVVGATVIILGNNLTGTTSVTFNGTAATFTVVSDTEITATVPSGPRIGKVQVVTPGGTLTSNVPFRWLK